MKKLKKCIAAFLSIVLLLFSVPQIGIKANATNDNLLIDSSYLLYQASEYSESFQQIFGGSSSSYANTYFYSMRQDAGLMAAISSWEAIHIATEPSYSLESGLITKRDMYKLVIFDLLGVNNSIDTISNEQASYVFGIAKEILDDSDIDISELKSFEVTAEYVDLLSKSAKAAQMIDAVSVITKIANASINMFDAVNACASYQTISNMKNGTKEILTAITELPSGSLGEYFNDMDLKELQDAARECISYFDGAYNNVLERILNGTEPYSAAIIDTAVDLAMDWAWDTIVSAIPGGLAVLTAAKGIRALSNAVFDLDDSNRAYYQLEADVAFENAIRKIMTDANIDYTKQKDLTDASFYMQTVNMYKNVVLLGFDYSIDLLEIQAYAPMTQAFNWLTGNYSECISLINEISEFKSNKQMLYTRFENIVYSAYKSLSPNYDNVINDFNNQVIVKAESVNLTQIQDINVGDTGYIDHYIQKTPFPENGVVDNLLSYTSENENVLKIDALGFFEAVGKGECTLVFDKYGDLKTSIILTVKENDISEDDEQTNIMSSGNCGASATWTLHKDGLLYIAGTGSMSSWSYYSRAPWDGYRDVIKKVIIENGISSVGAFAFSDNTNLKSIVIPESIENIGSRAFYGCKNLKNVIIPYKTKNIAKDAFSYCSSLSKIEVVENNSVFTDVDGVLFNKDKTTLLTYPIGKQKVSYIVPDSVTTIDTGAFANCTYLNAVTIGGKVTKIKSSAFSNCNNLETIKFIGNQVIHIGEGFSAGFYGTFEGCTSLKKVYISDLVAWCNNQIEGDKCSPFYFGADLYIGNNIINDLIIPSEISKVGSHSFEGCGSINNVVIEDGVSSIGSSAFRDCDNLNSITIPSSIKEIGMWAFDIYNKTLDIHIENLKSWCEIDFEDYVNYTYTKLYINDTPINVVEIPNDTVYISECAFKNCKNISEVIIPDSVTSIGGSAFDGCSKLKNVKLSNCISQISGSVFSDCGFDTITLPSGINSIAMNAFSGCSSLSCIYIPKTVTNISIQAFNYCTNLSHVFYEGTPSDWEQITIDNTHGNNDYILNSKIHYNSDKLYVEKRNVLNPTCTNYGSYELWCTICNEKIKTYTVSSLGHQGELISTIEPTCTVDGYSKYRCSVCEKVYTDDWVSATGHSGTLVETINPTCISDGYNKYRCSVCEKVYTNDWVSATGHSGVLIEVVNPTCISKGYDIYKCKKCESEYNSNYVFAIGHSFVDGLCDNCGALEDDCIESEHDYSNNCDEIWTITKNGAIKIAVTFSEDTYTERNYDYIYIYDAEDNLIGKYDGDELASQIIEVDTDTIKIRLTSDSSSTAYGFKVIKIEAYYDECQHINNEIINCVETSCTNDGYSGDVYCRDCMMIVEYGEIISSIGHNYTSSIITPTCTENGYTIFSCSACGDSYEADKKEKLGHNLGEWICTKEATCSEMGEEISMCSRCEYQENRTINVLSHTNSDGNSFCDVCEYDVTLDCSHISHSDNWFLSFIWKIALFFNRIFGNNKYCDCGVAHW